MPVPPRNASDRRYITFFHRIPATRTIRHTALHPEVRCKRGRLHGFSERDIYVIGKPRSQQNKENRNGEYGQRTQTVLLDTERESAVFGVVRRIDYAELVSGRD